MPRSETSSSSQAGCLLNPPEHGHRASGVSDHRTLQSPPQNALSHLHAVVAKYSTDMIDEYFRYRKKICVEALSTDGIRCCVLWHAAFLTLKAGKIMLIEWQARVSFHPGAHPS